MKKMYFASNSTLEVYQVYVVRETDKTLHVLESGKERRYSKAPAYGMYFDSEIEAWRYLREMTSERLKRILNIEKQIERLNG